MDNHYAKFDYKGMKTVGVTDYTNQKPQPISDGKMSKFNIRKKIRKYLSNVHKYKVHIFDMWTIIMQSLKIKEWKLFE